MTMFLQPPLTDQEVRLRKGPLKQGFKTIQSQLSTAKQWFYG